MQLMQLPLLLDMEDLLNSKNLVVTQTSILIHQRRSKAAEELINMPSSVKMSMDMVIKEGRWLEREDFLTLVTYLVVADWD